MEEVGLHEANIHEMVSLFGALNASSVDDKPSFSFPISTLRTLVIIYLFMSLICGFLVTYAFVKARRYNINLVSEEDRKKNFFVLHFDVEDWNYARFILGAITIMPARLIFNFSLLGLCSLGLLTTPLVAMRPWKEVHLWNQPAKVWANFLLNCGAFLICHVLGHHNMKVFKVTYSGERIRVPLNKVSFSCEPADWDSCFNSTDPFVCTSPLLSPNHVALADVFGLYRVSSTSFLSKGAAEHIPIIGKAALLLRTVFVTRADENNRRTVKEEILKRQRLIFGQQQQQPQEGSPSEVSSEVAAREMYLERKGLLPNSHPSIAQPFTIFPEGTTTNGISMVPFKTGIFSSLNPVSPVVVYYPYKHFNVAYDAIPEFSHCLLAMASFVNHFEIHFLSPSFADHAAPAERGLVRSQEELAQTFANQTRARMIKYLGSIHSQTYLLDTHTSNGPASREDGVEGSYRARMAFVARFFPRSVAREAVDEQWHLANNGASGNNGRDECPVDGLANDENTSRAETYPSKGLPARVAPLSIRPGAVTSEAVEVAADPLSAPLIQ